MPSLLCAELSLNPRYYQNLMSTRSGRQLGFLSMYRSPTRLSAESESLLLVTRPNDNHSPGSVIREVSP